MLKRKKFKYEENIYLYFWDNLKKQCKKINIFKYKNIFQFIVIILYIVNSGY